MKWSRTELSLCCEKTSGLASVPPCLELGHLQALILPPGPEGCRPWVRGVEEAATNPCPKAGGMNSFLFGKWWLGVS